MKRFFQLTAITASAVALAGCATQEREVVVTEPTPIYAKDGTIIGTTQVVRAETDVSLGANEMENPEAIMDTDLDRDTLIEGDDM
ncbi:hypothetical protein [Cognatishimia sp. MH4019]|uniref:hypothetical protein n=1 Tax=Cognatishimia sp. MH4019 TaxID=2854030 RepID=UPI001CD49E27|nr:hypothetical protein [Cognatishimia sp. MH4019]